LTICNVLQRLSKIEAGDDGGQWKGQIQNLLETDMDVHVTDRARNSRLCGPLCNNTLHDRELCTYLRLKGSKVDAYKPSGHSITHTIQCTIPCKGETKKGKETI